MINIIRALAIFTIITLATASNRPEPVHIAEVLAVYDKPWYSGYLDFTFKNKYSAHMHYFYFPSQSQHPETDPILFWFNGGPGCSSLLGALYEHGPFIFNDAFGFLMNNPQAWNKRANTVYIESPAQVGFSYFFLDPQQSYPPWDDELTADLNLNSVLQFLKTFPEYQGRDTYIAGQSYGGIYVPTLAYNIHMSNVIQKEININLKGFAVGNGCTDSSQCQFLSQYPHYLYQLLNDLGMISDQIFATADKLCLDTPNITDQCNAAMNDIDQLIDGINIYDAYRPCWQNSGDVAQKHKFAELRKMALRTGYKVNENLKTFAPPCVDSQGIDKLLNDYNNRRQLGIPENVLPYSMCVPEDQFDYTRSKTGSYYVYMRLLPLNKYKMVIYSGDSDPAVPISGTFKWMTKIRHELNLSTQEYWRPWMVTTKNGLQNAGAFWGLSNQLSLVQFKGVGHMAPQWNSQGGTKLINYLLFGQPV